MAPIKVTFKTVQGNKFELDLDSADKVRDVMSRALLGCTFATLTCQRGSTIRTSCNADARVCNVGSSREGEDRKHSRQQLSRSSPGRHLPGQGGQGDTFHTAITNAIFPVHCLTRAM